MAYKIPDLPLDFDIETKAVLKKTASARSALAEMKGSFEHSESKHSTQHPFLTGSQSSCKENRQKLHMSRATCIENRTFLYMT